MTWNRAIAILIGIVASLVCGNLVGINWYVSFAIGIAGYFVTRYVLWGDCRSATLEGRARPIHQRLPRQNADAALAEYNRWTALD
jgi:hypothetical protein